MHVPHVGDGITIARDKSHESKHESGVEISETNRLGVRLLHYRELLSLLGGPCCQSLRHRLS